jgi:hypothetical protein
MRCLPNEDQLHLYDFVLTRPQASAFQSCCKVINIVELLRIWRYWAAELRRKEDFSQLQKISTQ